MDLGALDRENTVFVDLDVRWTLAWKRGNTVNNDRMVDMGVCLIEWKRASPVNSNRIVGGSAQVQ